MQLVASDMDGTFLRDDKSYNTVWFDALYERLRARGCRFAAASGKQYHSLVQLFPRQAQDMVFIAENGALVMQGGKQLFAQPLPRSLVSDLARLVARYGINLMMCGARDSYVLPGQTGYRMATSNYPTPPTEVALEEVARLDEDFYKFSLLMPEDEVERHFKSLTKELQGDFTLMSSGFGYLDILRSGANKGTALEFLCEEWGIPFEERMAFGDAGNDMDMLRAVKYSYAMENATPGVKELCQYAAPGCNDDGVLQVLEQMLEGGW